MAFSFKKTILNIIFPICCLGCGQENKSADYLCKKCFKTIKFCGKKYNLNLEFVDEVIVAGDYDDKILTALIKSLKFNCVKDAGLILARFLSLFWQGYNVLYSASDNFLIIPLPLSKKRLRRRGFNQAEIIARILANDFGYELNLDLKKIKETKAQSDLSENKRKQNIQDAFYWTGQDLNGRNIILIDDVITTGSTVNEAAKTLKSGGAGKIIALAVVKG